MYARHHVPRGSQRYRGQEMISPLVHCREGKFFVVAGQNGDGSMTCIHQPLHATSNNEWPDFESEMGGDGNADCNIDTYVCKAYSRLTAHRFRRPVQTVFISSDHRLYGRSQEEEILPRDRQIGGGSHWHSRIGVLQPL